MVVWDFIVALFSAIWDALKKLGRIIWAKILSFKNNIVKFFRDKRRLAALKKQKELMAVTIKKNLDNGNYNTVNCLFNTATNEVEDYEEDAVGYEVEELDEETERNFNGKDMMILS